MLTVPRKIELLFCRVPVAAALRQTAPIATFLEHVEIRVDHGPIVDLHVTLPQGVGFNSVESFVRELHGTPVALPNGS